MRDRPQTPRVAVWLGALMLSAAALCAGPARAQDGAGGEQDGKEGAAEGEKRRKRQPGPFTDQYADDWFNLASPGFELHGYYRVRSELFHNFSLGRKDAPGYDPLDDEHEGTPPLWPRPPDSSYVDNNGVAHEVSQCGSQPNLTRCHSKLQAGANMRLRIEPSVHVSDNLRVVSHIDMLDNIVLGSTPQGYANAPALDGGYAVAARGGYSPTGTFASTQWAPVAGVTSTKDTIAVKRVWGEYASPIGKVAFGRMPQHWGLGMLYHAGDGYDDDWHTTVDRLQFSVGLEDYNLHFSAAWDFANEGPSSSVLHAEQGSLGSGTFTPDGPLYDLATKDDLDQWVFMAAHQMDEQLAGRRLSLGDPVVNTGLYLAYRQQELAIDSIDADDGAALGQPPSNMTEGLVRRGYEAVVGDLWLQLRYRKVRVEVEAALIYGTFDSTLQEDSDYDNIRDSKNDGWTIRQFGLASETSYRTFEDRLRLGFGFGYASGDDDVAALNPVVSASSGSSMERQLTLDRTYSTFRFHPNYRVDLILFRNILTRVQGAYYFRPSVDYDFYRDPEDGQRIGGGAAVIWSRASETVQAPGHAPDLGAEINLKLHYQLSPGRLHTDVDQMGGFFTSVEYGVLFPLAGLDYLPGQSTRYETQTVPGGELSVKPAQSARWYLGIMF